MSVGSEEAEARVGARSDTDAAWEAWGATDPYYGVLTNPMFRRGNLTADARKEFFLSGQTHVAEVMATCRNLIDPSFAPESVLDFGCGVGRLVAAFAPGARTVVGVDVSLSMLVEAKRNLQEQGIATVDLRRSDDALSQVPETFDLVHSCIVLQHIEVERGRTLFGQLIERIRPGGVGALHVTFGLAFETETFGQPKPTAPPPAPVSDTAQRLRSGLRWLLERMKLREPPLPPPAPEGQDPVMLMNYYNLSELFFLLQRAGIGQVHTVMTNHGGALGAFLYFRRP